LAQRINVLLSTLHAAQSLDGMNLPNFRLHPLKGKLKGFWSVTVRQPADHFPVRAGQGFRRRLGGLPLKEDHVWK
jgi:hypothetical protein